MVLIMNNETENYAYAQARAQMNSILELVAALNCDYDRLGELNDQEELDEDEQKEMRSLKDDAGECTCQEDAETAIQEDPLSIEIRSDWHSVGDASKACEFAILLSTGGPAVRIHGELNDYHEPYRAWIEYQGWGTSWMEYHGKNVSQEALLTYSRQFYFGE